MAVVAYAHLYRDKRLDDFRAECARHDNTVRLSMESAEHGGVTVWLNDEQYAKVRQAINAFEASESAAVEAAGR